MTARFVVGDVRDVIATIPDNSVDFLLTSPPFLALRSYLPADHPDKAREIGSEPDPATFIDTLLELSAGWRRVLAPHGSICVELGDTYAGGPGSGQLYEGTNKAGGFNGSANQASLPVPPRGKTGWPLAKSLCLVPELYRIALAYGRNPLTGTASPAGQWRIRNVIRWCLDGDTVVYARTPKGEGPTRLLHLAQNWQPGQWELWDGERWTHVLGWSATEATDAIEIVFRNGERISATREHEWPTQRGLVRTDDLTVGDVVRQVTLPEPTRTEPAHLPDDDIGWLVGTFMADGSFDSRDRIQISGNRAESAERMTHLSRLAAAFDGTASAHDIGDGQSAVTVLRSPILAAAIRRYVGGDGARNKHLRAAAWRRSNRFLSAVLGAYLAGDGHYDVKNDRWRLGFTDNPWLARDLRVVCARLGHSCRITRQPRAADPRGGRFAGTATSWHRGEIRFLTNDRRKADSEIVALRLSRRRRFYDIGVEGDPHLFALGSGILTHNCRPNPPVGALADKFRPATSDLVVACTAADRWFDLDAVRTEASANTHARLAKGAPARHDLPSQQRDGNWNTLAAVDSDPAAGAPPLDWWKISPAGYAGAHYATFPDELCVRPIEAMCPRRVCRTCNRPSRRITDTTYESHGDAAKHNAEPKARADYVRQQRTENAQGMANGRADKISTTTGWTTCGCPNTLPDRLDGYHTGSGWRPGVVLDPFAGTGTTLLVAHGHGRDSLGIDLDPRNAELARERLGMFLEVDEPEDAA